MLEIIATHLKDLSVLRKLVFAATHLPPDLPNFWGIAVEFATSGKVERNAIDAVTAKCLIDNIEAFDQHALKKDDCLLKELVEWVPTSSPGKPLGIVLISKKKVCSLCRRELVIRKDRPSYITIYDSNIGSAPGTHYHKTCSSRVCCVTQYYGYYSTGGNKSKVYYDSDWSTNDYFVSSSLTAYSMGLIRQVDSEILIGQLSYKQISDIFNYNHCDQHLGISGDMADLVSRYQMDRRRLEDAHFQYAILQVASWYPQYLDITTLALHGSTKDTLLSVVAKYHGGFMAQYAKHQCDQKGCGRILILDGNMKNHRDVCLAHEAGYAEFCGLPGKMKTGCPNTPQPKSRYCSVHTPTAFTPQGSTDSTDVPATQSTSSKDDEQLAFITAKKITRQSTFYQVTQISFSKSVTTWEPASCLPPSLISEYEKGVQRDIDEDVFTSGGQTIHTVSSKTTTSSVKRQRLDLALQTSQGCDVGTVDDGNLRVSCNTLKDKVKLNYSTAGIIAGVWPCGKITLIGELFGSESLSQVYGFLHTFLFQNQASLVNMSVLCYDDGCHLKKYVEKRKDLTETAKQLASYQIVVDKMHFRGHVDKWCQENCNPYKLDTLDDVDTEVCEQTFSWLSRFSRITRHMNREHFLFYILYICDLKSRMKK